MLLNSHQYTASSLHRAGSRAAFTSQYVAHHLGNIIASPSGENSTYTYTSGENSTYTYTSGENSTYTYRHKFPV